MIYTGTIGTFNSQSFYQLLVWHYTFGVFGVVGRRLGPFDIVGAVRPLGVGVVLPVGVCRPDLVGVAFGVEDNRGVDRDDLGGVGVVDRPNAVDGVGVVERPNGWRGLIYRGVPVLVEGVRGFVGVVMFDDELLRRFERDKLPDEPDERKEGVILAMLTDFNQNIWNNCWSHLMY